jgi:hypothetical protein
MSTLQPSGGGGCGALLRAFGCGPRGCFGLLVALAAIGVVVFASDLALRAIFDPWALQLPDRPTLLGEWTGTMRTGAGLHYGVGLRIEYHGRGRGAGRGGTRNLNIDGRGQGCNWRGERYDYELYGGTDDRDGTSSDLTLRSLDKSVNGSGWGFQAFWDGGDRVTLSGLVGGFELDGRPTGGRSSPGLVDPLVADLRHASFSSLDQICASLAAEGR